MQKELIIGHFYFIKDQFFIDFPDTFIPRNKNDLNNSDHSRPCFYAIKENNIYWLVPISTKVDKYRKIYKNKVERYGYCDTLVIGKKLGYENAFLIQNMFPITIEYIDNEYLSKENKPVIIDKKLEKEIIEKANKILILEKRGIKLLYTDINTLKKELINRKK